MTVDRGAVDSPYLQADDLHVTFPQMIARQAAVFPDRELLVDGDTRLTYAEFSDRMTQVARALMALGVEPGDKVAVWAPNSVATLVATLGASAAGAALLPMNSRFKGVESVDVVRRGRPRVLFTVDRFLGTDYPAVLRAAAGIGDLDDVRIVVLTGDAAEGDLTFEAFLAHAGSVPVDAAVARRESASPDAVSDIILTSGTTGHPKGVMTSHQQNVLAWIRYAEHFRLRTGERINATLPFFHNFGFKTGFLVSAMLGGTCVSEAVFEPAGLARLIEPERITFLKGTPALFSGLLSSPARHDADLISLRLCLVAGAMVPRELGIADADGYIRVADRKKDMFLVGGFNAYPAEIERLLLGHPGIAEVAVVGMPDERLGEVGAAFVVAAPGVVLDPADVIAWARDTMSNYKVPRHVALIAALLVNASMKVLKHELRALLLA